MEVQKFSTDFVKFYNKQRSQYQSINKKKLEYGNSIGYKLYYYKNFELFEITKIKYKNNWDDNWGDTIFFLNNNEFEYVNKLISKSKELYDEHIKGAKLIAKMPMSAIYTILKK